MAFTHIMLESDTMTERDDSKRTRVTGIYLDKEIDSLVRAVAAIRGVSNSQLISDSLKEYFTKHHEEIQLEFQTFGLALDSFRPSEDQTTA